MEYTNSGSISVHKGHGMNYAVVIISHTGNVLIGIDNFVHSENPSGGMTGKDNHI